MTSDLDPVDTASETHARRWLLLIVGLALALVCLTVALVYLIAGQHKAGHATTDGANRESIEVFHYQVSELSALAGYLSDLDDGRLKAAPPIDWFLAPRSDAYVARFVFDRTQNSPLPRITIEAGDAPFDQPSDLTEQNLGEFVEQLNTTLDAGRRQALERTRMDLVLGDVACVAYQVHRELHVGTNSYQVVREVLVTLHDGRLYTVSLDSLPWKLDDYRADAWAVVASLRFLQPPAPSEPPPASDSAEPADKQPDAAVPSPPDAT